MSPNPFELPEIELIAGLLPAFDFDRLISQGGMGVVYKARQRSLDRDVAIKILPRGLGDDPIFRNSFQSEARAMARLSHPNLIRVYDFGDLDGLLYVVMEYVGANSLFHCAHRKAIDSKQAVEIVHAACMGLVHAHENGIIHRDIRPANILLTPKCEPKIADFGLARSTRNEVDGLAMDTPAYMAPEVLNHPEKGDPQSDVFALGVILQELLTGIPAGTDDALPVTISDPLLANICHKATHEDPASRYPDAASFAEQLTRWKASKTLKILAPTRQNRLPCPAPVRRSRQGTATPRALLKNFALFTFLIFASYLGWTAYQKKHEAVVRQQLQEGTKSTMQLANGD